MFGLDYSVWRIMAIIYVKETMKDDKTIILEATGRLDSNSIPTLADVCFRHLGEGHHVTLDIDGLFHISREGRQFLESVKENVVLENIPFFIKLT